ncbi:MULTISPECIES: hypothetical protein [unclassified Nonomuraea]|uniref:hypothetical protein n=1 Tax=unclassified Nonomuraea TaxID=2593643 RepID=UPI00191C323F|nr:MULTISPECIES: hypothetical protein [unclassified Nonomuraea]
MLLTRSDAHIRGLTAYRYAGDAGSPEARQGIDAWLRMFLAATVTAAEQAERFGEHPLGHPRIAPARIVPASPQR